MGTITIDLRPKTEAHNPNAGNGREVLRQVYYRITAPFYEQALYSRDPEVKSRCQGAEKAFFEEVRDLLVADGWIVWVWPKDGTGGCPELTKGHQHLYCHPQSISGAVTVGTVEHIAEVLAKATTFKHYHTDEYRDEIVTTSDEDELQLYHETYDAVIMQKMQEALTTKRRNLYKRAFHATWELYSKQLYIRTTRVQGVLCSDNPGYRYVMETFGRAVKAGDIIYHENAEDLCRWRSKYDKKAAV